MWQSTGELLPCRHVGLLIVHVMEGRDLKKMDMLGKADPFLEMYTQPTAVEKTVGVASGVHTTTWLALSETYHVAVTWWTRSPTQIGPFLVCCVNSMYLGCDSPLCWCIVKPLSGFVSIQQVDSMVDSVILDKRLTLQRAPAVALSDQVSRLGRDWPVTGLEPPPEPSNTGDPTNDSDKGPVCSVYAGAVAGHQLPTRGVCHWVPQMTS